MIEHSFNAEPIQEYVESNKNLVVLDHLEGVRILMDRYKQYKIVDESDLATQGMYSN